MKQIEVTKSENVAISTDRQMNSLSPQMREFYQLLETDPVLEYISKAVHRAGSVLIERLRAHQNRSDINFWNIINSFNFGTSSFDPNILSLIYNKEWSQDRIPTEGFGAVSEETVKHECYGFFIYLDDCYHDVIERLDILGIDIGVNLEECGLTERTTAIALFRTHNTELLRFFKEHKDFLSLI